MIIFLWTCLFIVTYTFVGYGLVLYVLIKIKRSFSKPKNFLADAALPSVTLLVAAWNEETIIVDKIKNTLQLDYPKELLQIIFITDGSTDHTPDLISPYKEVILMHNNDRHGKMAAIKRAMPSVDGEIIVFSDANTFLNREALRELVKHYQDKKVGAVAGEKRILVNEHADASSAGEGFYWKYESRLKKWDYELYSNVGAAGELFSIRTSLYEPIESDTIIDDHMIAMRIAEKGYLIAYEPAAYASETASENTGEELKRKIRIAAGGIQSILRLKIAANPFRYPVLTFQYLSHRVLRWTITPFLLVMALLTNIWIVYNHGAPFYTVLLTAQCIFYVLAILGFLMERKSIRIKPLFIPYYFCMMNYAVAAGIVRYINKSQSAAWERSLRK
ncbi:glycosyl transferase [Pedobacter sp. Leaf216]|uniref:glycosyltransferase family 2 protein n=1 Tax=Pedobacter sp. Leaf216 TaxID=1735684 RepID=UPI0006FBEEED|nr:glycosyltransferase family 2 protein [Pedobacter sp. Leaf216]KQM78526.1 glycosyl transferase [Pedobacter sp. Leaf216]